VKFIPSHVSFISKSNSENYIEIDSFLTKLQTKISWLLFYGPLCSYMSLVVTKSNLKLVWKRRQFENESVFLLVSFVFRK